MRGVNALSNIAVATKVVLQCSVIGKLLLLVIINCGFYAARLMMIQIGGKSIEVELIQSKRLSTTEYAPRNGMVLKASKSQHLRMGLSSSQTMLFPNQNGTHVPLPKVMMTKGLGVIFQNTLSPRAQLHVLVTKFRNMLAFM